MHTYPGLQKFQNEIESKLSYKHNTYPSRPYSQEMAIDVKSLSSGVDGPGSDDGKLATPPKRPKLNDGKTKPEEDSQLNSSAFSSSNLLKSLAPTLKLEHDQAIPYRHSVLKNIFGDQLLRRAHDEIRNGLSFSLKETDIYKVRPLLITEPAHHHALLDESDLPLAILHIKLGPNRCFKQVRSYLTHHIQSQKWSTLLDL
jgi:hypothetical protein